MSHDQTSKTDASAPAYGIFMWQLMKARDALKSLSAQAFAAKDRGAITLEHDDMNKLVLGLLASTGRSLRNDISQSIRNNCAGSVLQIVWTLFDAHLEVLGVDRQQRRNVAVGELIAGSESFSRVLWASRNAFAHGWEWATVGPRSKAGRISVEILKSIGFPAPSHEGVYDYFALLSDGDIEILIQRLAAAAKEASQSYAQLTRRSEGTTGLLAALIALGAILVVYYSLEKSALEFGDKQIILVFQSGSGEDAQAVPVAKGPMKSPLKIRSIIEEQAIEGLSPEAARPFKEVAARVNAWSLQAEALVNTKPESERFYRDVLDLCERMDEIYDMVIALPNPVSLLLEERRSNSLEDMQKVLTELLEATTEFKGLPFRVVNKDIVALGRGPADSSQSER